jgi:hypothetical protein
LRKYDYRSDVFRFAPGESGLLDEKLRAATEGGERVVACFPISLSQHTLGVFVLLEKERALAQAAGAAVQAVGAAVGVVA